MYTNRSWLFLFLLAGSAPVLADSQADANAAAPRYLPQFELRFEQKQWYQDKSKSELLQPEFKSLNEKSTQIEQFDAHFLYPLTARGMEVGVGLNIRYIQGISSGTLDGGAQQKIRVDNAIPALHARALFDLPFQGFSAGLEGSHTGISDQLFDYRAQLRYEWTNGLGLQGGWQHQQMSLDLSEDSDTTFSSQGPYLDLKWRF